MAMITCPECGKEISDKSDKCIQCGCPINGTGQNAKPQNKPEKKKSGCSTIFAFVIIGLLILIALPMYNDYEEKAKNKNTGSSSNTMAASSKSSKKKISKISWRKLDSIYSLNSNTTEMQKDEHWKSYKGKRVQWTGIVSEIGDGITGLTLQVKMNRDTFTSDLLVKLLSSEKNKALNLRKGGKVTFQGTLDSWGTILPITLDDGVILK